MKFGRPEDYHNNIKIRLMSIDRAIAQYQFSARHHKATFQDKIVKHTTLFIKGLGNEINFLSAFKELFFNSRELFDILLLKLNKETATRGLQTNRHFLPFAKQMMKGNYDELKLSTIDFLKTNITYIFHIRKIRNEIKNSPSKILFRYNTNRFEAYFTITINTDEKDLISFVEIAHHDEALKNMSYQCVCNLDEIFPEMLQFWQTCLSILDKDSKNLTNGSTQMRE